MHTPSMLREKILAVEIMREWFPGAVTGVVFNTAFAQVAAPEFEHEVLDADVAGPFVFAAEDGGAAVAGEDAGEGPAVLG